ncbi:unnamed protein product [Caenorhabditis nigoni]
MAPPLFVQYKNDEKRLKLSKSTMTVRTMEQRLASAYIQFLFFTEDVADRIEDLWDGMKASISKFFGRN